MDSKAEYSALSSTCSVISIYMNTGNYEYAMNTDTLSMFEVH